MSAKGLVNYMPESFTAHKAMMHPTQNGNYLMMLRPDIYRRTVHHPPQPAAKQCLFIFPLSNPSRFATRHEECEQTIILSNPEHAVWIWKMTISFDQQICDRISCEFISVK
jgi:hypothetical protein